MKSKIDDLIQILCNSKASIAERDDAAMDLAEYRDDRAINALLQTSKNKDEDELILNSCGESLGSIWVQMNIFDYKIFRNLPGTVKHGVYFVVKARKPEWVKRYALNCEDYSH